MAQPAADKDNERAGSALERPTPEMITAARIMLAMPQKGLAAAAGVSLSVVDRYERGVPGARIGTLGKIVAALGEQGVRLQGGTGAAFEAVILTKPSAFTRMSDEAFDKWLQGIITSTPRILGRPAPKAFSAARHLLNLSQREAAEAFGISRTALLSLECGNSDTRMDTIERVGTALIRRGVRLVRASDYVVTGVIRVRSPFEK